MHKFKRKCRTYTGDKKSVYLTVTFDQKNGFLKYLSNKSNKILSRSQNWFNIDVLDDVIKTNSIEQVHSSVNGYLPFWF